MMQYLVTALAGLAVGIVGMRIWQTMHSPAEVTPAPAPLPTPTSTEKPSGSSRKLLIAAGGLAVLGLAIVVLKPSGDGDPAGSALSGALAGNGTPGTKSLDDVDTMISRLAARLQSNPKDGEGWRMLGWSYVMTGHPDKAIEPYRKALALLPNNATVHAGYGEAVSASAGNIVTPEAKVEFDKALAINAAEPRARYFNALWLAQNGKEKEAIDKWIALANGGPVDAPWQADVRKQVAEYSKKAGIDVSARLKPATSTPSALPSPDAAAMQPASGVPEGQRQAMVEGMVEGLASKLKTNPKDSDGWVRLLRSRMVLNQEDKAAGDLATARKALANDSAGLASVNEAAVQFGVPGAR